MMDISPEPNTRRPWGDASTPYEEIGGESQVLALSNAFYDQVEATSPVLVEMLPADTSVSRQKLFEFLSGWMGGPQIYWERRGHPRLRMRHAPFAIDTFAAEEWVRCLAAALDDVEIAPELRDFLVQELGRAAGHLRNQT